MNTEGLHIALARFRQAEDDVERALSILNQAKIYLTDEIRRTRELQGTTIRKFSLDVGLTAAFLSDMERGRRFPNEKNLQKIMKYFLSLNT